ncbi:Orotidine 5'-phosphate decarboxylase protein [Marine Group I thaumarchaeote SCGC AAA799-E16]|uniref:Orotidine 5'-phosphate decarboxylase n=4 Tax=Marine Group I TaxID=905826 RepID=A0A081RNJ5_9ARCH|nr:Orotidine 5'-phosphate decarboxylase protein [Marine Group I thaumarchaeote SCGC AAA799-N04]KER06298.1 Orotidine 5'-phosphate decarboxylase protein [Marine Group I thaumarchaeote SCGC AAA799-E16]KFM15476.1 Orotidine 5'-phosphate decarboxylase protein [Marine Group I thaumarchaeote SCGC AAA799-D11]KFM16718.1 Orotidine 5'-phosphate decarboxylase protein [Marine Group I thaumarchaeote SCGC RSA3]
MLTFKTRLSQIAKTNGKVILANDYDPSVKNLDTKTISNIKKLHPYLCAVKLNFHLLLPLSGKQIQKINKTAHQYGLQTIADIKLNDIGNTNRVTTENLWKLGFDAVIANPIMGLDSLKNLVKSAHKNGKGVITLCHMSAPEAKLSYDMEVKMRKKQQLYQLFLDWALEAKVDGIVVGATFPKIIQYCSKKAGRKLGIFSPGVGTQGGNASEVISAGTNYLIVGRTILNAKKPIDVAKNLQLDSLGK